jgi:hypothetical protein
MLRITTGVFFSILNHLHLAWTGLAVVPFPGSLNIGGMSASAGMPDTLSSHDAMMTIVALCIELALFVLVPIYLRARRRKQISSAIRILYDSRREQSAVSAAPMRTGRDIMPHKAGRATSLHLVGGSRLSA